MSQELPILVLTFFLTTFSGALMPGPVLTVAISESAKRGSWAGLLVSLGHVLIEAPLIVALLMGFTPLLSDERLQTAISLVGGAILLWMGYDNIRLAARVRGSAPQPAEPTLPMSRYGAVVGGFLASLFNPWFPIWWVSIGAYFLKAASELGLLAILLCVLAHWSVDLGWYGLVGLFVGRGRRLMEDQGRVSRRREWPAPSAM